MVRAVLPSIRRPIRRLARSGALILGTMAFAGPLEPVQAAEVFMVQLASVKSEQRATGEWNRLRDRHGELLGDLELMLQRVDLGERGIFFRMQTGPFPNLATAQDMCRQLKAARLDCIVAQR